MLAVATVGFAVTFWAWALLSPLGATLREQLGRPRSSRHCWSPSRLSSGPSAASRSARSPTASALAACSRPWRCSPSCPCSTWATSRTRYRLPARRLLPRPRRHHVRDRHPVRQRLVSPGAARVALGIFGVGMGGTAISAFTTVQLTKAIGPSFPFDLVAVVLVVYAVAAYLLLRDRPDRPVAPGSMLGRLATTLRMPVDLAAVVPLRRRVRRLRRVQRVPAHLPHHRLPTSTARRRPAHRRFRGARRRHAPRRRLALRPAAPDRRARRRLRRRRGRSPSSPHSSSR